MEQRNAQHQVEQFAHYDLLSGLANRTLFKSSLNETLLCINLDYFKTVNVSLIQLRNSRFLDQAESALQPAGLKLPGLEIEITEKHLRPE